MVTSTWVQATGVPGHEHWGTPRTSLLQELMLSASSRSCTAVCSQSLQLYMQLSLYVHYIELLA